MLTFDAYCGYRSSVLRGAATLVWSAEIRAFSLHAATLRYWGTYRWFK